MTFVARTCVLIFTLILVVQAKCAGQLNRPFTIATTPDTVMSLDTIITMRPDAGYEPYLIRVRIFNPDSGLVTISTSTLVDHQRVERICNSFAIDQEYEWSALDTVTLLKFADIDFDGFDDLFLLKGVHTVTGLQAYDIWLFDSTSGSFQWSKEFNYNVYSDYELDEADTTITSRWIGFPDSYQYGFQKYKVRARHLVLIEREARQRDDNRSTDSTRIYTWKHEKLVGGVLQVVGEKTVTLEELMKQDH